MSDRVLVSACLLGRACRYDGRSKAAPDLARRLAADWPGAAIVPVCPEELGGLGTPRPAAQLSGGDGEAVLKGAAKVLRVDDQLDITDAFIEGARLALEAAPGARGAVLKARSPSCGRGLVWRDGSLVPGDGVFAALLKRRGIGVKTDVDPSTR